MTFLLRLAKHQGKDNEAMEFDLDVHELRLTQSPGGTAGPIEFEWVRGSQSPRQSGPVWASTDKDTSNYLRFKFKCPLRVTATMYVKSSGAYQTKKGILVFKQRSNKLGELELDLSLYAQDGATNTIMPLSKCKDPNATVQFSFNRALSPDELKLKAVAAKEVEMASEAIAASVTQTAIQSPKPSPPSSEKGSPRTPPKDHLLTAQLTADNIQMKMTIEALKKNVVTWEDEFSRMSGESDAKGLALIAAQEENMRLQIEQMKMKPLMSPDMSNGPPSPIIVVRRRWSQPQAVHIEDPHSIKEIEEPEPIKVVAQVVPSETLRLSQELIAERAKSTTLNDQVIDRDIECNGLMTRVAELEREKQDWEGVISRQVEFVMKAERLLVTGSHDLHRCIDAESSDVIVELVQSVQSIAGAYLAIKKLHDTNDIVITKLKTQRDQVLDKWKSLSGKVIRITPEGDVDELGPAQLNVSDEIKHDWAQEEVGRAKTAFERCSAEMRHEIADLRNQLQIERSHRSGGVSPTGASNDNLEAQLVASKMKLAQMLDRLLGLEQENDTLKESLKKRNSSWM